MAELERRTPPGAWRIVAASEELSEAAAELAQHWESRSLAGSTVISFAGVRANLRWNVLEAHAPFLPSWRTILRLRPIPLMHEYANLVWLSERLFQTPRPLAAGVSALRIGPCSQFIVCEELVDVGTLKAFLRRSARAEDGRSAPEPQRESVMTELARELARMHALRFVHGDLTPEHILVGPESQASRIHLSGPSRGGPRLSTRGALGDLADLVTRVRPALTESETRAFVAAYVDERRAQGSSVDATRLTREIERRLRGSGQPPFVLGD